jgi:putative ABC transport system substrate-binding protein
MAMKRRDFVAMIIGGATAWPLLAQGEQGKGIPRVGYIDPPIRSAGIQGFLKGLKELGYVHGRNIKLIQQHFAAPTVADMRTAISAIIRDIDILVVSGTVGGIAAKSAPSELPVVFISVGAPVDIGLVKSLAKPGGNMTGVVV